MIYYQNMILIIVINHPTIPIYSDPSTHQDQAMSQLLRLVLLFNIFYSPQKYILQNNLLHPP